ncbi:MAG: hypothetical protein GX425_13100 [Peptococcaceae bacterium]|nr:hypothetical protein [Peptococcaceae bacterium]
MAKSIKESLIRILKNSPDGLNLHEIAEQLNNPPDQMEILRCLNEGAAENIFEMNATPLCDKGVKYQLKKP